jgi:hypothetical protein
MRSKADRIRYSVEALVQQQSALPLAPILTEIAERLASRKQNMQGSTARTTLLFKVSVFIPDLHYHRDQGLSSLVRMWLARRLDFGNVFSVETKSCSVRVVFVEHTEKSSHSSDAAVVVVVPSFSNAGAVPPDLTRVAEACAGIIPAGVPFAVLCLADKFDAIHTILSSCIGSAFAESPGLLVHGEVVEVAASDAGLLSCIRSILQGAAAGAWTQVERISPIAMCSLCVSRALWYDSSDESYDDVMKRARNILGCLLDAALEMSRDVESLPWPPAEFALDNVLIRDYFGKRLHLPLNWTDTMEFARIQSSVQLGAALFHGNVFEAVSRLLSKAPVGLQQECEAMLEQRMYRRSLQTALLWAAREEERAGAYPDPIYLPAGLLRSLVDGAEARLRNGLSIDRQYSISTRTEFDDSIQKMSVHRTDGTSSTQHSPVPTDLNGGTDPPLLASEDTTNTGMPEKKKYSRENDESDHEKKRRRLSGSIQSQSLRESSAFTKQLLAMLQGGIGNVLIGQTTLAALCRKGPDVLDVDHIE